MGCGVKIMNENRWGLIVLKKVRDIVIYPHKFRGKINLPPRFFKRQHTF